MGKGFFNSLKRNFNPSDIFGIKSDTKIGGQAGKSFNKKLKTISDVQAASPATKRR